MQRLIQTFSMHQGLLLLGIGAFAVMFVALSPSRVSIAADRSELDRLNDQFAPRPKHDLGPDVEQLIAVNFIPQTTAEAVGLTDTQTEEVGIPDLPQILVIEAELPDRAPYLRARIPGEDQIYVLVEGDEINNWRVEEITPSSIVFRWQDSVVSVNPFATDAS